MTTVTGDIQAQGEGCHYDIVGLRHQTDGQFAIKITCVIFTKKGGKPHEETLQGNSF